ncbi:myocyte-specific enhancer factor 2A-like isoform X2 [Hoplias malabaricus]|uniref:myocyte-specific enhancer factor 2A-like isoform X2 n=1 Tax=Hoplias malabaricus TaxID=27720 RepID=UPI00346308E2
MKGTDRSNKLFQYASTDMDKVLLKYTEYNEPHESRTNSDIVEALNKKEQRGCESPEPDTSSYVLTPHTEEKYQKINEEFDNMMRNHKLPAVVSQQSFTLPVAIPVAGDPSTLSYSTAGSLVTPGVPSATVSLSEAAMLSLSSSSLHTSPSTGLAGAIQGSSDSTSNGVHSSSIVNGFIGTKGDSSLGRGLQAKSPAPPAGNLAPVGQKPELRVLIPPSCKGTVQTLRINSPQSSQSLTTPVVSMATPSLPPQGLPYTTMTSAYNADYSLSSSELSNFNSGFNLPESLSLTSGSSWQHTQLGQSAPTSQGVSLPLTQVSSSSPSVDIKAEPISPPQEHGTPLAFLTLPPPASRQEVGRSPAESLSSSCSSYEGSDREDQRRDHAHSSVPGQGRPPGPEGSGGPSLKRLRTENWVT